MQYRGIPTSVPELFKQIFIVWIALLVGQTFFLIFCFALMVLGNKEFNTSLQNIFLVVGIFLPMILIFVSLKLFNQKIENIDKFKSLIDKLIDYRAASIIRWAMIEVIVFVNLVFFLAAGNQYYLLIGILMLG